MTFIKGFIIKLLPRPLRQFLREYQKFLLSLFLKLGYWKPKPSIEVDDQTIDDFINVNSKYWPHKRETKNVGILIEGHLSQYGPNYLFRTAVAALALNEKNNLGIEVVFNGFTQDWSLAKKIYGSFGINKFLFLESKFLLLNIYLRLISKILAYRTRRQLNEPIDILEIKFNSIKVGDLIYDDILKNLGKKTITEIDNSVIRTVAKSYFYYLQYSLLFRIRKYEYYVSTHTQYSQYGLLCRIALMNNVKLLETTDIQMSFYDQITNDNLPTYHDGIKKNIKAQISESNLDKKAMHSYAGKKLKERFDSKIVQIDAKKAFSGRIYDKNELRAQYNLDSSRKIAFIVAHVFSDSPHLSSSMLHADYFDWLLSTIKVCTKIEEVSWFIKPHPSSEIYNEEGFVEEMIQNLNADNIYICPDDLNTKSLSQCADVIVTVHGTVGLEFSCIGIPVVLAGSPFYSGFGFTIEPKSILEYESILFSAKDSIPLTTSQVNKALEVFAIWEQQFDWYNPIITADVLANVWGSGVSRNVKKAYELITENLRQHDPKELKLWNYAQRIGENRP